MPRTARIFMTNRSQAVRLPKAHQFSTDEVFIRKEGEDVILSPRPQRPPRQRLDATAARLPLTRLTGRSCDTTDDRESSGQPRCGILTYMASIAGGP